jgi:hypothetical protein
MHFLHNQFICIVTQDVQLGGVHAGFLRGPTPRNLVVNVAGAFNPLPAVLVVAPPLPRHTRWSQNTTVAAHWMG